VIVRNLIEALELLRKNLDRVELWTAALACFQHPAPEYQPGERLTCCRLKKPRIKIANQFTVNGADLRRESEPPAAFDL